MFLFCLLLAYVVIRMSEDINATIRGHENPRHAYRMKKLEARAAAGRRVPTSAAGRYFAGLVDDGFDSAYHRRQLMAEHRAERRERRAARRIERQRSRWAARDAKRARNVGGPQVDEPTANVDPAAPEAGPQVTVDPSAAPAPAPVGFHVRPPQAPEMPGPAEPGTAGDAATAGTTGTGSSTASSTDSAATPASPAPAAGELPAGGTGPAVVAEPIRAAAVGFHAPLPSMVNLELAPDALWARQIPDGEATQELSRQILDRAAEVNTDGFDQECVYPLTAAQQATVDAVRNPTSAFSGVSSADFMALPTSVRADLLHDVAANQNRYLTVEPGQEDVEAFALLNSRCAGAVLPSDIYVHPDNAHPEIQARMAAEREQNAAAQNAAQPAEQTADGSASFLTGRLSTGAPAGKPFVDDVLGASYEDSDTGYTVPAEATTECPCGGAQMPHGDVTADELAGTAEIATHCSDRNCSITGSQNWRPTDAEYEAYFGHAYGDFGSTDDTSGAADATDTSKEVTDPSSDDIPNNVIPFQRHHNSRFVPTRMELPVTNPTPTSDGGTEVTGLGSAISYAGSLAGWCTHIEDQVSTIVPTAEDATSSCEQALEGLREGGVTGQALVDIATVQEQVMSANQAVRTALANYETAKAAADSLKATLVRHQQTVGEAYQNNPDAGTREFVTAE